MKETSNSLIQLMNAHRSDIKHNNNKPAANYFNTPDHTLENLRSAIIKKKVKPTKTTAISRKTKITFKFDCVIKV